MMARYIAITVLGSVLAFSDGSGVQGRWAVVGLPMAYNFRGDSVEILMVYPPQGSGQSYRVQGDSVVIQSHMAGVRRTMEAFSLRGDTLDLTVGRVTTRYYRIGAPHSEASGFEGSWRFVDDGRTRVGSAQVLTFRSDGELVPEAVALVAGVRGDTLQLTQQGQSVRVLLHHTGDALTLSSGQTLVRRPWGCFGIGEIDRSARECR